MFFYVYRLVILVAQYRCIFWWIHCHPEHGIKSKMGVLLQSVLPHSQRWFPLRGAYICQRPRCSVHHNCHGERKGLKKIVEKKFIRGKFLFFFNLHLLIIISCKSFIIFIGTSFIRPKSNNVLSWWVHSSWSLYKNYLFIKIKTRHFIA